ncbi:hypothetical protein SAMN05421678_118140 [Actinopolymorpha cephalotaxi]|uniref:Uncharacterized protein n=1 Tax=Actinopolymorpha cephalotaxi TaxID=504797 RepID=A0A1I3AB16_9ACTN|nr:hypothetical protein [Actinopolymorpha cephalotaxi]NYH85244.1 hypothetical protein [Actinopolymorpha cephalotaxi]SFH47115.1 hypothetical protein SAMN05421678_118140 [Actinopolymorpha cephalotaxi]
MAEEWGTKVWLSDAREWVAGVLIEAGVTVVGELEPHSVQPWSAVWRVVIRQLICDTSPPPDVRHLERAVSGRIGQFDSRGAVGPDARLERMALTPRETTFVVPFYLNLMRLNATSVRQEVWD